MQFKPLTPKELEDKTKLPTGSFPAEVITAEDTVSKTSGNEMIKLKVCVFVDGGRKFHIDDYLMPSMEIKFAHFCAHAGLQAQYEDGSLCANDCEGKSFYVKLGIEKGTKGYADKCVIKDYISEEMANAKPKKADVPSTLAPDKDDKDPLPF